MAVKDARSLIKQWFTYEAELFEHDLSPAGPCPEGSLAVFKNGVRFILKAPKNGTGPLLGDLFSLATEKLVHPYQEYNSVKYQKRLSELDTDELRRIQPEWKTDLDLANQSTHIMSENRSGYRSQMSLIK